MVIRDEDLPMIRAQFAVVLCRGIRRVREMKVSTWRGGEVGMHGNDFMEGREEGRTQFAGSSRKTN